MSAAIIVTGIFMGLLWEFRSPASFFYAASYMHRTSFVAKILVVVAKNQLLILTLSIMNLLINNPSIRVN